MNAEMLRASILQKAMEGNLLPQLEGEADVEQIGKAPEEVPFEIPNKWKWVRLSDILTKLTDGEHKTPKYKEKGIPFLSVKNISSGKIDFSQTKFISKEDLEIFKKRCDPKEGDILLSKVGTIGVPAIVECDEDFGLFVSVALLKLDGSLIRSDFLYYQIFSPHVQQQARKNTRGVGNKNWVLKDIAKTLVVLPPLEEQKRITKKIEELLPLIEEYGRDQERLEKINKDFPVQMEKSLLQEAVSGKLVPQLDEEPEVRQVGEAPEEAPFEIPEKWRWVKLSEVASLIAGQSPDGTSITDNEGGLEFHQGKSFFSERFLDKSNKFTSDAKKLGKLCKMLDSSQWPLET